MKRMEDMLHLWGGEMWCTWGAGGRGHSLVAGGDLCQGVLPHNWN